VTSDAVAGALLTVPRHRLLERFWVRAPERLLAAGSGHALAAGARAPDLGEVVEYRLDPRHPDPGAIQAAYADDALMTRFHHGRPTSSTSQPGLMAEMLELLDLHPGERVLEIGTGTGYNAALLSELVGDQRLVTTVDIDADVMDQTGRLLRQAGYGDIRLVTGDGFSGCAEGAPYDKVVATVGCTDLSPSWVSELRPGGLVVVPLEHGGAQPLLRARRQGPGVAGRVVTCAGFVPIQGRLAGASPWAERVLPGRAWPGTVPFEMKRRCPLDPSLARRLPGSRWGEEAWRRAWDLHYCVALWDRRATSLLTLHGREGARASLELLSGELVLSGAAEGLAAELLAHVERWVELGAPQMSDFVSELTPLGEGDADGRADDLRPGRPEEGREGGPWVVERVAFRQTVRLDRGDRE
jgi:protein-L-isoaspartate(D-aspartate) O-methyltransferase